MEVMCEPTSPRSIPEAVSRRGAPSSSSQSLVGCDEVDAGGAHVGCEEGDRPVFGDMDVIDGQVRGSVEHLPLTTTVDPHGENARAQVAAVGLDHVGNGEELLAVGREHDAVV
jgi:hypothetical protein